MAPHGHGRALLSRALVLHTCAYISRRYNKRDPTCCVQRKRFPDIIFFLMPGIVTNRRIHNSSGNAKVWTLFIREEVNGKGNFLTLHSFLWPVTNAFLDFPKQPCCLVSCQTAEDYGSKALLRVARSVHTSNLPSASCSHRHSQLYAILAPITSLDEGTAHCAFFVVFYYFVQCASVIVPQTKTMQVPLSLEGWK